MKTLQEQINEQIELARRIKEDNPSVNHIIVEVKDIHPQLILDYAQQNKCDVVNYSKNIGCQAFSDIGIAVFIRSTPAKLKQLSQYEYETL